MIRRDGRALSPRLDPVLAGVALVLFTVGLWLAFGVSAADALIFAGAELGFAVVPGVLAYRGLVTRRGGALRQLAFGWSLGLAIQIGAFALGAATGLRGWLPVYPVLVAALALPRALRGDGAGPPRDEPLGRGPVWAVAVVGAAALVGVALGYFMQTPLPPSRQAMNYLPDTLWDLSLAADVSHHWPITNAPVSGAPLTYYNFTFYRAAAIHQLTGIPLPVVVFRLYLLPLVLLLALQLVVVARAFTGRRWLAPLGAAVVLFVGELDPLPGSPLPFLGSFFSNLYTSPTYLLGFTFFLPVVVLAYELVSSPLRLRRDWPEWVLLAVLLVACTGSKAQTTLLVAGGLVLFLARQLLRARRVERSGLLAFAVLAAVWIGFWFLQFGRGGGGLRIAPFSTFKGMAVAHHLLPHLPAAVWAKAFYWPAIVAVSLVGLCGATLAGLVWLLRAYRPRLPDGYAWLLCLLAAGLLAFCLFGQAQDGHLFLLWYGLAGGGILAAEGLAVLWRLRAPAWASLASGGAVAVLLLLGLVNIPIDLVPVARDWSRDETPTSVAGDRGMTLPLYRGLTWLRDHSSPNAVLAVNNHYTTDRRSEFFYYSAFAERRVFLESWFFTLEAFALGNRKVYDEHVNPFPGRIRLNDAVFGHADPRAMRVLARRYGVRYLVVDKVNGTASPELRRRARLVFSNGAVDIYGVLT